MAFSAIFMRDLIRYVWRTVQVSIVLKANSKDSLTFVNCQSTGLAYFFDESDKSSRSVIGKGTGEKNSQL